MLRKSIFQLSKLTEPEVAQTRLTLLGLVGAMIVVAILQQVWRSAAVSRLLSLTDGLTFAGKRFLTFQYSYSYLVELGRWSDSATSVGGDTSPPLLLFTKLDEPDPDNPVYDVA